jgi:RNA polymerase sigma-70 factor, ECF subfamily
LRFDTKVPRPTRNAFGAVSAVERVEALYHADSGRLWRSVYAFTGDRTTADDAVAEAFAQLLRRGDDVRDPRAWIWRAAFRIAAGEVAYRSKNVNELRVDVGYLPEEQGINLLTELDALSGNQRASLVLHDYAGYTAREVAEIIGSTEAAVRVHVMRARRRLKRTMTR